jgi:molybdenum cofactor biosynthesis protein B
LSAAADDHRAAAPRVLCCAALTVSDTRTLETDRGGDELQQQLQSGGHGLWQRAICADDPAQIRSLVQAWVVAPEVDVILMTGGTGISQRDQTFETVRRLLTKELPGYGELFRWLSYQEIGAAAMLSRAIGGLIDTTVVLTMPGSPAAVRLAMQRLILPELGHLVQQARK